MAGSYGTVYLSGGITGLTKEEYSAWREEAALTFIQFGVAFRDPTRTSELENLGIEPRDQYGGTGVFYTQRAIMVRDYNDVRSSDVLLVNLLLLKALSIGTIMELAWAYALQKPAVVVMEPSGNPHDNHPMLLEAAPFRVTTLQNGIDAVLTILGVD